MNFKISILASVIGTALTVTSLNSSANNLVVPQALLEKKTTIELAKQKKSSTASGMKNQFDSKTGGPKGGSVLDGCIDFNLGLCHCGCLSRHWVNVCL